MKKVIATAAAILLLAGQGAGAMAATASGQRDASSVTDAQHQKTSGTFVAILAILLATGGIFAAAQGNSPPASP